MADQCTFTCTKRGIKQNIEEKQQTVGIGSHVLHLQCRYIPPAGPDMREVKKSERENERAKAQQLESPRGWLQPNTQKS